MIDNLAAEALFFNQQSKITQSKIAPHWYGIIRRTLARSPSLTNAPDLKPRFRFVSFEVRM
jgi:hypothetical protein